MKSPKIFICLLFLVLVSCGKQYTCECTAVSAMRMGNSIDTTKQKTNETDRYKDQEEARLMCENIKIETSTPSFTSTTNCKIK